jgi:hypothetical protein
MVGRRQPNRRRLRTAEPRDQGCVEAVGLVADQLARAIGLDPGRIDDADAYAMGVQDVGEVQPPVTRGFHAGVQGCGRVGPMPRQPDQELL